MTTFSCIAAILIAVVMVFGLQLRDRVTRATTDNLAAGQRMIAHIQERRQSEIAEAALRIAGHPDVARALADLQNGIAPGGGGGLAIADVMPRVLHELDRQLHPDGLLVVDQRGLVMARAGRDAAAWQVGTPAAPDDLSLARSDLIYPAAGVSYFVQVFPVGHEGKPVGALHVATALDNRFADALASLMRTPILIVVNRRVVACTLPAAPCSAFADAFEKTLAGNGVMTVASEPWAVQDVFTVSGAHAFAVDALAATQRAAMRDAWTLLGTIALGALLLGGLVSVWLARSLSHPIDNLSRTLSHMATSREFSVEIPRSGKSRELDVLTDTFNGLMRSLASAESDARAAYLGAIRALAVALDARDPYTAGHSERVSALAVSIGRQMALSDPELDVLRLAALLHDIGKIGVSDDVLRKAGPLDADEFEAIKSHARVGARILRSVPFLAPHLPIVELHHERPDGLGYPHGLAGDEIPLLARIVRVADAFDAMTTARAYRAARPAGDAIAELWHHAGSQFDPVVVEAFARAWPLMGPLHKAGEAIAQHEPKRPRTVVPFASRATAEMRH
ncbi:MAG: HD domain-containing phosphohydrolase [Vicinamibacterales bacterium]